jgi:hypothetical protein
MAKGKTNKPAAKAAKQTHTAPAQIFSSPKQHVKDLFPHEEVAFLSAYAIKALNVARSNSLSTFTYYDRWDASLLAHFGHRQRRFGLPMINTSDGVNAAFLPFGNVLTPEGLDQGALDFASAAATSISKSALNGRYNYYTGLINDSVSLSVAANSSATYIGCFRPDFNNSPLFLLDSASNLNVLTDPPVVLEWTENPFYGVSNSAWQLSGGVSRVRSKSVDVIKDLRSDKSHGIKSPPMRGSPCERKNFGDLPGPGDIDLGVNRNSFAFIGGYELVAEHVNKTAYTSTAWKLRTSSNTIHDFLQFYDNITSDSINIGTTTGFVESKSIYMATTGNKWQPVMTYCNKDDPENIVYNVDPNAGAAVRTLQTAILNDWPVFQVVVTNSGPDTSSITLNFTANGWHGIAPLQIQYAGAMAYETVPFTFPSWPSACKTVGVVKRTGADISLSLVQPVVRAAAASMSNSVPRLTAPKSFSGPSSKGQVAPVKQNSPGVASRVMGAVKEGLVQGIEDKAAAVSRKALDSVGGFLKKIGSSYFGQSGLQAIRSEVPLLIGNAGTVSEIVESGESLAPLLLV